MHISDCNFDPQSSSSSRLNLCLCTDCQADPDPGLQGCKITVSSKRVHERNQLLRSLNGVSKRGNHRVKMVHLKGRGGLKNIPLAASQHQNEYQAGGLSFGSYQASEGNDTPPNALQVSSTVSPPATNRTDGSMIQQPDEPHGRHTQLDSELQDLGVVCFTSFHLWLYAKLFIDHAVPRSHKRQ